MGDVSRPEKRAHADESIRASAEPCIGACAMLKATFSRGKLDSRIPVHTALQKNVT